jgi:hypothetical protein
MRLRFGVSFLVTLLVTISVLTPGCAAIIEQRNKEMAEWTGRSSSVLPEGCRLPLGRPRLVPELLRLPESALDPPKDQQNWTLPNALGQIRNVVFRPLPIHRLADAPFFRRDG